MDLSQNLQSVMQINWKEKCLAMALHLSISIALIGVLLILMFTQWFPDFYFDLDGGWDGLKIVVAVDLILGPLLTFCVYRKHKPGLKMDLSLIAALQLVGFFYGSFIIYEARPLALVFFREAFYVVSADLFEKHQIPDSAIDHIPGRYPKQVVVDMVSLTKDAGGFRQVTNSDDPDLLMLKYDYYHSLEEQYAAVDDEARDLTDYLQENPEYRIEYEDFFRRNGGAAHDYLFLPVYSRYHYHMVGIRKSDKRAVDTLKIRYPFPNELPRLKLKQSRPETSASVK